MSNLCFLALLSFICCSYGDDFYHNYQVWKVDVKTKQDSNLLQDLQAGGLIDVWSHGMPTGESVMLSISPQDVTNVSKQLFRHNLAYKVHSYNLQSMVDLSYPPESKTSKQNTSFDLFTYHRFDKIVEYLNSVVQRHNDIATLKEIGKGYEGTNPMLVIEIKKNSPNTKRTVVIDCGIHSREWVAVSFCLYFIHQLTNNQTDPRIQEILLKYNVMVLPVYNPDGYVYTWTKSRLWRKNRRPNKGTSCVGVDLNRNFVIGHRKSYPCQEDYSGLEPESELETHNFVKYVGTLANLHGYFTVHSYAQLWLYPYAYKSATAPNDALLNNVAKVATEAIKQVHGQKYRFGNLYRTLYAARGTSMDFMFEKLNTSFSYTIELRDRGNYGFLLPTSLIKPTVEEAFVGMTTALLNI